MELITADYVALATALAGAIVGLFIGFSGALAFLLATVAAGGAASFAWPRLVSEFPSTGLRGTVVAVGALIIFGLVRAFVKRFIHGLVAQPGDAIFGAITNALAAFGSALAVIWIIGFLSGDNSFDSALLNEALKLIGQR